MTDFDSEIDAQHRAAQDAEDRAVAVIQRMRRIPGLTTLVDKMPRRFGEPPNPYRTGSRNLTVAGLLEKADPALAHYLAMQAGTSVAAPDYAAKAEAEARAAEIKRMQEATERAAAENELLRRARERASLAGINFLGRRYGT